MTVRAYPGLPLWLGEGLTDPVGDGDAPGAPVVLGVAVAVADAVAVLAALAAVLPDAGPEPLALANARGVDAVVADEHGDAMALEDAVNHAADAVEHELAVGEALVDAVEPELAVGEALVDAVEHVLAVGEALVDAVEHELAVGEALVDARGEPEAAAVLLVATPSNKMRPCWPELPAVPPAFSAHPLHVARAPTDAPSERATKDDPPPPPPADASVSSSTHPPPPPP